MVSFPNCKINLGLNITRKREDGYHDLETIFYPVGLKDALEAIKLPNAANDPELLFNSSGLPIAGEPADNLCIKAWHLVREDFPALPAVQLHLHKAIPMGAGLGGGSADGAFTLTLLNNLFQLDLSSEQLHYYALRLGSDCPFFLQNKPCYATGRGEQLQEIELDLSDFSLLIVSPGIHVSTAAAFSGITPKAPAHSLKEIIRQPVSQWRGMLVNDFEEPVGRQYPGIIKVREALYDSGALYASMTGSGSAVFGLFEKGKDVQPDIDPSFGLFRV
ncbi:MAG: 4-(cytidine 5-diphospho)-2-C-methyl-D-erythritol kinase [Sediminibacterium sp.]|nr:4-(cytidine 5-diphospho)-2-C-methyl-D-erythritol kinase [Sediminibacterium sp.]